MLRVVWQIGMVAGWVASAPPAGRGVGWEQFGLLGLVIGFVLWRDWKRENDSNQRHRERDEDFKTTAKDYERRLDAKEELIRATLETVVRDNTEAMRELRSNCSALQGREI